MLWPALLLALPAIVQAALLHSHDNDGSHHVPQRLPTTWHHPEDHPVNALFKRGPTDGTDYPTVGSPTWSSAYPRSSPDVTQLPKEWVAALDAAVAAGKIPNIPQSKNVPGVNPVYPNNLNPNGPEICSATYKCVNSGDIWNAPDGTFATSFDDGPTPASPKLLQFLASNNEVATHFMIGVNILSYPQLFLETFNSGNDIAVHTWTHPYMTTLSNLEIVAQLGWTSEIIRNSTGGRVPKYWRPPYGDSDNRVRAIAKEIFGLQTVIWNRDTLDWSVATGGTTPQKIHDNFVQWLGGPKSPGLMVLEHETSDGSVQAFMDAYTMIKPNGWRTGSLTRLVGDGNTYANSKDANSSVQFDNILAGNSAPAPAPTSGNTTPAPLPSSAPSFAGNKTSSVTPTSSGQQQSAQTTSNAALPLVSRDVPWSASFSLSVPALLAVLAVLV
ncbi:hypothetical protein H0H81_005030 [Sphagnurus paluster]|uniref:chitin deacetylase n=1 Tax=Sphagnurus paluster TaxID=117069 RepID=A0A9P7GKS2_9AGAR|nr:hypothetical protein H0H81_005030 [Sphagnurus paluster]